MHRVYLFVCAAACAGAVPAQADIINISGSVAHSTGQTGANFKGTIDYQYLGGVSGQVTVTLFNATPTVVGGYITGFVFNIDSADHAAGATLVAASNPNFLDTGNEAAPPFGNFDAGAALGANWTGGGSPLGGIPVGQSATFTFALTAADASGLSAVSFAEGPRPYNLVARFRGLTEGSSDKVPVPAPSGLALIGVAGALAARRRR